MILLCVFGAFREKKATIATCAALLLFALHFLYSAIINRLQLLLIYLSDDYSNYYNTGDVLSAVWNLFLALIPVALFVWLAIEALKGFRHKYPVIITAAFFLTEELYYSLKSVISISDRFFRSWYDSIPSYIYYSLVSSVVTLLLCAVIVIFCLNSHYPAVYGDIQKKRAERKTGMITEQYQDDVEEIRHRLNSGMITQEQYDDAYAELTKNMEAAVQSASVPEQEQDTPQTEE